jgi:putative tryptophan/tyrosine transport system substrate-binding protein
MANRANPSGFQVLLCLMTLFVLVFGCNKTVNNPDGKSLPKIAVIQLVTNPGIDAVRDGFISGMESNGFVNGKNVSYLMLNSEGDAIAAELQVRKIISEKCTAVFAITTPTAQTCFKGLKDTGIPLVFGAVTDPISAGLVNTLDHPGNNTTGTSDKWPTLSQFKLLLDLVPTVKKVGVVYNPGEANSEANIKEVQEVCSQLGLTLILENASDTKGVELAATSLVGKIDAFYVSADNTVITAMDIIVKISEDKDIPLLPGVSSNVEQGGFGTLGPDYVDIGNESAKIMVRILKGEKAGEIAVATASRFEYFFNTKSAKATKVIIPDSLLKIASKVY